MTLSLLKSLLTILILVYLGLGALLYFFQQHFIFFPSAEINDNTQQNIKVNSADETLNIWQLNPGEKEAIIFFGGNAANAHHAIPQFSRMFKHKTVYLVDYRGYGGSTGSPSEKALYEDALVIYDYLKPSHDNISLVGQSLGSGVCVHLASQRNIEKLILVTPFDSIEAVAINNYPFYPISWLLKDKFDSISRVPSITAKTLVVIAENDRIIPKKHAYTLASAFNSEQVTIKEISRSGHNTIALHPSYERLIIDFLNSTTMD